MPRGFALIFLTFLALSAGHARAADSGVPARAPVQAAPVNPAMHPTGLPLPRFASLKADKAYVRSGPGMQYPFEWVYQREGLPVEIVQEYEQWRKIRDADGSEGWINALLLSGKRTALVRGESLADMVESTASGARVIARLEPGVLVNLNKCTNMLCQVSTGGYTGWVSRISIWGIYAREELN
jgi:SH3-like domain-containing protein